MLNLTSLLKLTMLCSVLLLSACSSKPEYRPANNGGWGYAEQRIGDNFYRITFKSRGNDSERAKAYAMQRAAELTKQQGFDWYVIVEQETLRDRERDSSSEIGVTFQQETVRDCSLLACRSQTVSRPQYDAGIGLSNRNEVEVALQVRMGKGVMPERGALPASFI